MNKENLKDMTAFWVPFIVIMFMFHQVQRAGFEAEIKLIRSEIQKQANEIQKQALESKKRDMELKQIVSEYFSKNNK